ncbi:MAG TPA: PrgI family protein, partial [Patescibacteria group bacterium]
MRTTVVPAQITSVEDRIAGNFTFAQVLLLIVPLLVGTAIYVGVEPRSDLSTVKTILVCAQFLFFGALAIRYNGKILAQWLVVYFAFYLR